MGRDWSLDSTSAVLATPSGVSLAGEGGAARGEINVARSGGYSEPTA